MLLRRFDARPSHLFRSTLLIHAAKAALHTHTFLPG